jgi:predicted nucleic-acid-binding protein
MNVTVDTNILVRSAVQDDIRQARVAAEVLRTANVVAVSLPCLCEFVWVLRSQYGFRRAEIAPIVERLCNAPNVEVNQGAVDAGLSMLNAGGDFADGVIAYEGAWLGGEEFVSFDKKAVTEMAKQGMRARLLR